LIFSGSNRGVLENARSSDPLALSCRRGHPHRLGAGDSSLAAGAARLGMPESNYSHPSVRPKKKKKKRKKKTKKKKTKNQNKKKKKKNKNIKKEIKYCSGSGGGPGKLASAVPVDALLRPPKLPGSLDRDLSANPAITTAMLNVDNRGRAGQDSGKCALTPTGVAQRHFQKSYGSPASSHHAGDPVGDGWCGQVSVPIYRGGEAAPNTATILPGQGNAGSRRLDCLDTGAVRAVWQQNVAQSWGHSMPPRRRSTPTTGSDVAAMRPMGVARRVPGRTAQPPDLLMPSRRLVSRPLALVTAQHDRSWLHSVLAAVRCRWSPQYWDCVS